MLGALGSEPMLCKSEACQQKRASDDADRLPTAILAGQDYGTYFFKVVCQFSTTVKGTEALCATGTPMRKRLPSAVTSPPIKPAGSWNKAFACPAINTGLALMST